MSETEIKQHNVSLKISLGVEYYIQIVMSNVTVLIVKITISSIVIGLKKSYFPLVVIGQFVIGQFVIGQFVIGQFVIGQFNRPITFKVVV